MTALVEQRPARVPLMAACDALVLNRSTYYRRRGRSTQTEQLNRCRT